MSKDLFTGEEIADTSNTSQPAEGQGRDLFAERGINPNDSQPVVPKLNETGVESSVNPTPSNPFMAAVTGFNRGVEGITGGVLQRLARGTAAESTFTNYMDKMEQNYQNVAKINPVSAVIGSALGELSLTAVTVPIGGSSFIPLAVTGAAVGGATNAVKYQKGEESGENTRFTSILSGSLEGGAAGAAGGGAVWAGKLLLTTIKGLKYITKSPDQIVDMAIQKSGLGNQATATLEDAETKFTTLIKQVKANSDVLYNTRNQIASDAGAVVKLDTTKALMQAKDEFIDPAAKGFVSTLMKSGTETPSFQTVQTLVSKIGNKAKDFTNKGEPSIARDLNKFKDALLMDSDTAAAPIEGLKQAQSVANAFYRETYSPLKTISSREGLVDNFVHTSFVQSVLRNTAENPSYAKAFQQMPDELQKTFIGAHINALKASKTSAEQFNAKLFSSTLKQELDKIPALSSAGVNIDKIVDIANVASKANTFTSTQTSRAFGGAVLGDLAFGAGTLTTAALSGFLAAKVPFLYSIGKVMSNKSTMDLVGQYSDKLATPLRDGLVRKIGTRLTAIMASAPPAVSADFKDPEAQPTVAVGVRG